MSNCDTSVFKTQADEFPVCMRYHVGCGGVYLRGYVNTDFSGEVWKCATVPPHATTVEDYYHGLAPVGVIPPPRRPTICDKVCGMADLPTACDKVLAVQCLEHVGPADAMRTLTAWHGALFPGGQVVVSVPDVTATLNAIAAGRDVEFHQRHLSGTRTGTEYHHRSWYTRERLALMLECAGYRDITFLANPHFYPALVVRAIK